MDTRKKIVETASRLFYKQGYNSTGINQVIKEADVAKSSLYQHFPSKEDLLIEYLRMTGKATNIVLEKIVQKHSTAKEQALALFDFVEEFSNQNEFTGCNFLNVSAELPQDNGTIKELIKNQKNDLRKLFVDILTPVNKQQLADELYLLFDAALIASKVYGDVWPVKTAKKIADKLL